MKKMRDKILQYLTVAELQLKENQMEETIYNQLGTPTNSLHSRKTKNVTSSELNNVYVTQYTQQVKAIMTWHNITYIYKGQSIIILSLPQLLAW